MASQLCENHVSLPLLYEHIRAKVGQNDLNCGL